LPLCRCRSYAALRAASAEKLAGACQGQTEDLAHEPCGIGEGFLGIGFAIVFLHVERRRSGLREPEGNLLNALQIALARLRNPRPYLADKDGRYVVNLRLVNPQELKAPFQHEFNDFL